VKSLKNVQDMIRENSFCVLSTCMDNRPNSSLMQYVCSESGTEIYMLAMKGSRKHLNIASNPNVSLLVDTRCKSAAEADGIDALTLYGVAGIMEDEAEAKLVKDRLVLVNPGLAVISKSSESCVIKVEVDSFLMLEGVADSRFGKIQDLRQGK
jgi:nitroimidazol reductase NimA-like FMN-containing flavoprotein (pyridoxamine 5'-phosphate oxidase superfamily)